MASDNLKFGVAISKFLNFFEFNDDGSEYSFESYPDQFWSDFGDNYRTLANIGVVTAKEKIDEARSKYVDFAMDHNTKVELNVDYDDTTETLKTIPFQAPDAKILADFCDLLAKNEPLNRHLLLYDNQSASDSESDDDPPRVCFCPLSPDVKLWTTGKLPAMMNCHITECTTDGSLIRFRLRLII